jgi:calcium-dependent protein kinase
MACKTLRKGVVFKDNTLFAPMKPEVLQCEVTILRTLAGEHYCMALTGVYETLRVIYVVTEYCAGGEMMEYVSKQEEDLRTDDVSRIAFQMLDAVHHCASHNLIHRDIKPENVMFKDPTPGSDLRLIDFGSGTDKVVEGNHTTFAGSAFYISPEMFQRTYTQKTDVWSVGVTLYVLVAGYPADKLQRAFNLMQSSGSRNLRDLPNFPENMPDSFYDMLEGALVYRHKKRKTAGELLMHEFVQFHKTAFTVEQIVLEAQQEANDEAMNDGHKSVRKTQSVALRGSVGRHSMFLDYQKYERSLTTLLATLLDKKELVQLMHTLNVKLSVEKEEAEDTVGEQPLLAPMEKRLDVIPMNELKEVLEEQKQEQV